MTDPLPFGQVRLDVRRILSALAVHDVRYVLVGGMAAVLHGTPLPTEDVDVTPEPSSGNLARLAVALEQLGAQWRVQGLAEGFPPVRPLSADDLYGKLSASFVTPVGFLDVVMVHSDGARYEALVVDSEPFQVFGLEVAVAALAAIRSAKRAAGRCRDLRALPFLDELIRRRAPGD